MLGCSVASGALQPGRLWGPGQGRGLPEAAKPGLSVLAIAGPSPPGLRPATRTGPHGRRGLGRLTAPGRHPLSPVSGGVGTGPSSGQSCSGRPARPGAQGQATPEHTLLPRGGRTVGSAGVQRGARVLRAVPPLAFLPVASQPLSLRKSESELEPGTVTNTGHFKCPVRVVWTNGGARDRRPTRQEPPRRSAVAALRAQSPASVSRVPRMRSQRRPARQPHGCGAVATSLASRSRVPTATAQLSQGRSP